MKLSAKVVPDTPADVSETSEADASISFTNSSLSKAIYFGSLCSSIAPSKTVCFVFTDINLLGLITFICKLSLLKTYKDIWSG